jgi:hypothetical protein
MLHFRHLNNGTGFIMKKCLVLFSVSLLIVGCGGGGSSKPPVVVSSNSNNSSTFNNSSNVSSKPLGSANTSSVKNSSAMSGMSSATNNSSTAGTAGVRYLPIGVNALLAPDILLVDPAAPATPSNLVSSVAYGFLTAPSADYNATTGTISNVQPAFVVYRKAGKLYKVDLKKGAAAPVAVQLSSETQAADTCSFSGTDVPTFLTSFPDYVPTSSVIFYDAVVANKCVKKAVVLGMSATDAPISLGAREIIAPFLNATTGRIAGFIIKEGTAVSLTDAALANATPLVTVQNTFAVVNGSGKSLIVNIDGAVKRFDYATRTLSPTLITYPSGSLTVGLADSAAYYWSGPELNAQGAATGKTTIYKLPDTSTGTLSNLLVINQSGALLLSLTPTKILVSVTAGYSTLPKTGGALSLLNLPAGTVPIYGGGERIFYVLVNTTDAASSTVGSLLSDNTGNVAYADARPVAIYGSAISLYGSPQIEKVLILEYASGAATMAKASISLLNNTTGVKTAIIGTLPDVAYDTIMADNFRYGVLGFCKGSAFTCDAFFHADTAGSLVRVTNLVQ